MYFGYFPDEIQNFQKEHREFKRLDDKENLGITKGQEINKCLKMVDFTIVNDSSLDNLRKKVDEILSLI